MGELDSPEKRLKYSRSELLQLLDKYEGLVSQLDQIRMSIRDTTFDINEQALADKKTLREKLLAEKSKVFCEKKLRHTIICRIPCHIDHEQQNLDLIEEASQDEEESKRGGNSKMSNFDPEPDRQEGSFKQFSNLERKATLQEKTIMVTQAIM